jgi:predicted RNase H-like HicB family nuclease
VKALRNITIVYEWSDDGWWVAEVAELPGAISQGRTKEEARINVMDAFEELCAARRDLALKEADSNENVETVALAS